MTFFIWFCSVHGCSFFLRCCRSHCSVPLVLGNVVVGIGVFYDCYEIFCRQLDDILCLESLCSNLYLSANSCITWLNMWWTSLAICHFFCNRCLFFGDVSSKRDPSTYLSYVFAINDYYQKEYCISEKGENPCNVKLPLIVNTSGWVKGKLTFFSCNSDSLLSCICIWYYFFHRIVAIYHLFLFHGFFFLAFQVLVMMY